MRNHTYSRPNLLDSNEQSYNCPLNCSNFNNNSTTFKKTRDFNDPYSYQNSNKNMNKSFIPSNNQYQRSHETSLEFES